MAYIPAVLNNAHTWVEIDKGTMDKLEHLQYNFLRILLATPASTPQPALVWDCGILKMKFRIMESKLNFLHYIICQDEESLAHQILVEQKDNNFPGLVQECNKFIEEFNIVEPFKIHLSKNEWKKMVKSAVIKANSNELKHEIEEKYKKLEKI